MKKILMSLMIIMMIVSCGSESGGNKDGNKSNGVELTAKNGSNKNNGYMVGYKVYLDINIYLEAKNGIQLFSSGYKIDFKTIDLTTETCESFGFTFVSKKVSTVKHEKGLIRFFYKNGDNGFCIKRDWRNTQFAGTNNLVTRFKEDK